MRPESAGSHVIDLFRKTKQLPIRKGKNWEKNIACKDIWSVSAEEAHPLFDKSYCLAGYFDMFTLKIKLIIVSI